MNTKAYLANGVVKAHAAELAALGHNALIVTGKNSAQKCGALADVIAALEEGGVSYSIFNCVEENPSIETVRTGAALGNAFFSDFVIGIGGGSPMDAAKAISVLLKNPMKSWKILYEKEPYDAYPVAEIPTTCGTGSEVTGASVLTRHDLGTKVTAKQYVYPDLALIDPAYLASAPRTVIRNTAIDALGHLIESYVNTLATVQSREKSLTGLHIWKRCKAYIEGAEITDREEEKQMFADLLLASDYAGMAILTASTSLPHALSYYLTYEKHVPHGMAIGIYLPAFLREADEEDQKALLDAGGFEDIEDFDRFISRNCIKPLLGEYASLQELRTINEKSVGSVLSDEARLARVPFEVNEMVIGRIAAGSEEVIC